MGHMASKLQNATNPIIHFRKKVCLFGRKICLVLRHIPYCGKATKRSIAI